MNFFQRKNSKRVKEADGAPRKGRGSRGKNDLFDRSKGGLETLAGNIQSTKNDAEAATQKLQGDDKAKAEFGSHSEATRSKEPEQGSEEKGAKNMEAFNAVLDKVKSNPEVVDKVKEEVMNLAEAFHLTKHGKPFSPGLFVSNNYLVAFAKFLPRAESKEAEDREEAQKADESTSAGKTDALGAVKHAVEEIQAVVSAAQQQQAASDETETGASAEAAAAEASAEGEKPEAAATTREAEKDDPSKRIGFLGFFAMLFERFCSPANKKKD